MSKKGRAFVLCCLSVCLSGQIAKAAELVTPFVPGISIGVLAGSAPEPGFYSQTTVFFLKGSQVDGQGRSTNRSLRELEIAETFLVSTDYRILGARYYAYAVQPFKTPETTTPVQTIRSVGAFNTILSPLNFSWNLNDALSVSYGTTYYLPDGTYSAFGPKIANGFFTFEQNIGLTFQKGGYALSANAVFDINALNPTTNYRSGSVFDVDLTATKSLGKLSVGAGAYYVDQVEDDKLGGIVVPATMYNGIGNRWREAALGPYVSYDLGGALVSAWYTQDVYVRNTVRAGTGWVRVRVPFERLPN